MTNNDIPKLQQEVSALGIHVNGNPSPELLQRNGSHTTLPLDFEQLRIELMEARSLFSRVLFRNTPKSSKWQVKVSVAFSKIQRDTIEHSLKDRAVFYECRRSKAVTAGRLLKGPWISDRMSEPEANDTAENAREGINDLRLIIQMRAALAHYDPTGSTQACKTLP